MSIFEQASRASLSFQSVRGLMNTEQLWQLWQLPLQSKSGFDLDSIAKAVNKELKATEEESFVTTAVSPQNARLTLQLEILKHIIGVKKQEAADALAKADKAAKRVTPADLEANIADVEFVKHVSKSGQVLRWVILTTQCGFAVVGKPSVSVSKENDDAEIGEIVAMGNSRSELWPLMGYALKQRLHDGSQA